MFCRLFQFAAVFGAVCFMLAMHADGQLAPQNDSDEGPSPSGPAYAEIVRADQPAAYWRFEDGKGVAELTGLPGAAPETRGGVKQSQWGPRREKFPLFDTANKAVVFDKPGSLRYDDGPNRPFDFAAGDTITLEAWVSPTKIASGQQVYIVGKGRTGNKGFPADNQNWSLRLVGKDGGCHISYLFRDVENRPGEQTDYHRWTSDAGFAPGSGWHYVAVSYQFGRGDSVRGYVDGRETKGVWDLGGKTDEPPVVDDDQVWIGSGSAGAASNSFLGGIDEVALYRTALPAERIAARWKVNQPNAYVTSVQIPAREVLVEVLEGMPDNWTWDFVAPAPSERFTQRELAFVEIPKKYNNHGVIDDRSSPFVLWAHGILELPAGKQRLLVRSRNAARLFIDDKLVVETPFMSNKTDGHNPYKPVVSAVSSRIRPLQPGDHEEVAEIDLPA
ncbi:MAG TPA: LamG domain-containing protein, partial [Pirellulaceae bacterium]|nr:LamG domain-containing protein [Pirellulaceae bacterium]